MATSRDRVWPLQGIYFGRIVPRSGGRAFGASRDGGSRYHVGVDLDAARGHVIQAMEDGTLVASQPFNGPQAHALLMETDSGLVLLYGEIEPRSWTQFGLAIGDRVRKGQAIGKVGINPGGSQMLHFETYTKGTRQNARWYQGQSPPPNLLDPTEYLEGALMTEPSDDQVEPKTQGPAIAGSVLAAIVGLFLWRHAARRRA